MGSPICNHRVRQSLDSGAKYTGVADEIHKALEVKDLNHAHGLVHYLKGLAGNLAAKPLLAVAIKMGKLVKGESQKTTPWSRHKPLAYTLKIKFLNYPMNSLLPSRLN